MCVRNPRSSEADYKPHPIRGHTPPLLGAETASTSGSEETPSQGPPPAVCTPSQVTCPRGAVGQGLGPSSPRRLYRLSVEGRSLNEKLSPAGPALSFLIMEKGPGDECGVRSLCETRASAESRLPGLTPSIPGQPSDTTLSVPPQTQRWASSAPTPGDADIAHHSVSKENPRAGRPRRKKTEDFPHQERS